MFDQGPGGWKVGKDAADGRWNRNILGQKGEGVPPAWHDSGGRRAGFARSESPWYFDSNHGEFMWFYMPLIGPASDGWKPYERSDLRDAEVRLGLRGAGLELRGTRLYLWVQGNRGRHVRKIYNPGDPLVNWALTSQAIELPADEQWHEYVLTLDDDEDRWSQMGLLNRGLPSKIIVEQSLTAATGTLSHTLNGHHHNIGLILGGVDPNDPPSGAIDLDEVSITRGAS